LVQRGQAGHPLRDGQQRGQSRHGVRCRSQAHPPVLLGVPRAFDSPGRIQPLRHPPRLGGDQLVPESFQPRREVCVQLGAVLAG
jgi:hypothetical protein